MGGGTRAQGGPTPKNSGFSGYKLQIFGAEGAENLEKIRVFKEKLTIFWSFKGKFGQILINIVILNYFGYKKQYIFFSIFKKLKKFQEIFGKFWEIFRKNCWI